MSNIINKIRLSGTDYTLSATTSGGVTSGEVETMISAATSGYTARFAEDEEVTAAALNDLNERISGISGNNVVELTQAQYDALVSGGTVDPTAFYIITDATAVDLTNYYTKSETNTLLNGKQDTLISGTNIKTINNESILGSGNIDIQGGGKPIEGGRGITVTTGETADTVSFNLPISAGTGTNSIREGHSGNTASGNNSHAEGAGTTASGWRSHAEGYRTSATSESSHAEGSNTTASEYYTHAEGYYTIASGINSHAEGGYTIASNISEHASGQFNVSSSASIIFGNSGNTLFSVGNGTADNARHNAFEIRQNGDIYLTKDGQDVKLQDQLGGGGGTVDQTIISGSTNAVAGGAVYDKFDEVEQVTAAALNALNDRLSEDEEVTAAGLNAVNDKFDGLKLKKLTQAEYDALTTKDAQTLYIIVN